MQQRCQQLAQTIFKNLQGNEFCQFGVEGEDSSFLRFNQAKVRQVGQVKQLIANFALRTGKKQAQAQLMLSGDLHDDQTLLIETLQRLRDTLPFCDDDPFLDEPAPVSQQTAVQREPLPDASYVFDLLKANSPRGELVGFIATGSIARGLFTSTGIAHWYETSALNCDWSIYLRADRAVKSSYAGTKWEEARFVTKCKETTSQYDLLQLPAITLSPGQYRVYLAPSAMLEIFELLGGSFGQEAIATKQTALLPLAQGTHTFHPSLNISEHTKAGVAPNFNEAGYVKPPRVALVEQGRLVGSLVSPRSAKEYKMTCNGASQTEGPESLEVQGGTLPQSDVLKYLDDGLYINNLWYLNYSARSSGKITGMTRFGAFKVEQGKFVGPINVMRFDDTVFSIFGPQLDVLTKEQDTIINSSTYDRRATNSWRLPGLICKQLWLTL